jgi:cytoskeletal protein RodZ
MIDKKTIITILSTLTHGRKKNFTKQTHHPRREWFIGLVLFLCIVCFGGVFSILNFTRFADIHLTLKATEQKVESYKENTVTKALDIYRKKEARFTALDGQVQTEIVSEPAKETVEEIPRTEDSLPVSSSTPALETSEAVPEASVATTSPVLQAF